MKTILSKLLHIPIIVGIYFISILSIKAQEMKSAQSVPKINATCGDMGAENGWSSWTAKEGYHKRNFNNDNPVFFTPGVPTAPRFLITTGAGVDPCTPSGGGPAVPVVAPGFGKSSIRIGQPSTNGIQGNCSNNGQYPPPDNQTQGNGCSEELRFPFIVGAQDTNFIYAYAIFVENPAMDKAWPITRAVSWKPCCRRLRCW